MLKKGQITTYVIVGIVILLLIGTTIYIARIFAERQLEQEQASEQQFTRESEEVRTVIDNCVRQTTLQGLELLGTQGGYIERLDELKHKETSFWYVDQVNVQPALVEMQQRLEQHVNDNLEQCANYITFERRGFVIEAGQPSTEVFITEEAVRVFVDYEVKVTAQGTSVTYNQFFTDVNVRLRKVFELASQIVNLQMHPQFKFSSPLELVQQFDFRVTTTIGEDTIDYTITDEVALEQGQQYQFTFASRFRTSDLIRTVELQKNSHTSPTLTPYTIYSLDRMAQLNIDSGTTMSLHGKAVEAISVQQDYPDTMTLWNLPMEETFENTYIDRNRTWEITYPVYSFSPDNLTFNQPQNLRIYWDEDRNPRKGNMGMLIRHNNVTLPLISKANYQEHFVEASIASFTDYTLVDCDQMDHENKTVKSRVEQNTGDCVIKAAIAAVILVALIFLTALIISLAGPAATATTTVALTTVEYVALSIAGALFLVQFGYVGMMIWNLYFPEEGPKDCINFVATCDQTLNVTQNSRGAKGQCVIVPGINVTAGQMVTMCAQVEKCRSGRQYTCRSCALTCKVSYK